MIDLKLPNLGEGIESGDVLEILVSVGDTISKDDGVLELETDKATVTVPAEEGGVVKEILVGEGDSVAVGAVIFKLEGGSAGVAPADTATETTQAVPEPVLHLHLPRRRPHRLPLPRPHEHRPPPLPQHLQRRL